MTEVVTGGMQASMILLITAWQRLKSSVVQKTVTSLQATVVLAHLLLAKP